jgi:hypothetical protein
MRYARKTVAPIIAATAIAAIASIMILGPGRASSPRRSETAPKGKTASKVTHASGHRQEYRFDSALLDSFKDPFDPKTGMFKDSRVKGVPIPDGYFWMGVVATPEDERTIEGGFERVPRIVRPDHGTKYDEMYDLAVALLSKRPAALAMLAHFRRAGVEIRTQPGTSVNHCSGRTDTSGSRAASCMGCPCSYWTPSLATIRMVGQANKAGKIVPESINLGLACSTCPTACSCPP